MDVPYFVNFTFNNNKQNEFHMTFVIIIQMNSVTNQTCQLYRVAKISDIDASIIFHFQKEIYERHQNIKEFYPIAVKIKKISL